MTSLLFLNILGFTIFSGVWWILQRRLFVALVPKSVVLFFSGIGASSLLIFSFFKYGLPVFTPEFTSLVILNIFLNVIISYCWISAVSKGEASIAVSVTSLAPVLAILTGYFILGERVGVFAGLGIISILIGTYIMNTTSGSGVLRPLKEIWKGRSSWLWYAIISAVAASITIPVEKHLIGQSNFLFPIGVQIFFGWGLFWGIWMLIHKEYKFKSNLPTSNLVITCTALCLSFAISCAFQGAAYLYGFAAVVASLKRLDGVVVVILGGLILKETNIRYRLLGIIIVAIGAFLIGLDKLIS